MASAPKERQSKLLSPLKAASPRIEGRVDGKLYGFLLDSGTTFSMASRKTRDDWKKNNPRWSASVGATGSANMYGSAMDNGAAMLRANQIRLGSFNIRDTAFVSRDEGIYEQ